MNIFFIKKLVATVWENQEIVITCTSSVLITSNRKVPLSLGYLVHRKKLLCYCYASMWLFRQHLCM